MSSASQQPARTDHVRIGIFGGTFDPVHWGHLLLAESAREQCRLDEVWFVPANRPPHKSDREITMPRHRLNMLELATTGLPSLLVSRVEIGRDGPSYTVDTLEQIAADRPEANLVLLMGQDTLHDFPTEIWRHQGRIVELAELGVVNRNDQPLIIPEGCRDFVDRILPVSMPMSGLSSSEIRSRVSEDRSILFRTPRAVELYIAEHGLYKTAPHRG